MKIVIAITGASGAIYAKTLIDQLQLYKNQIDDVGVVFSKTAREVWNYELGKFNEKDFPFKIYKHDNFYAPFASGSSTYTSMVVCPCTMGTLAKIANGFADNLIARAADVMLKESSNLIIVPRETPYNLTHLENMKKIMLAGGKIVPASPSFYSKPQNFDELSKTVTDKILNLLNIKNKAFHWSE